MARRFHPPVFQTSSPATSVFAFVVVMLLIAGQASAAERPNVVLVMTDDQGYGDLACHGNPVIKTPNLDALHNDSIRLTNFHVDPTCSPTRAALMTGHYSCRTGVWHTIMGRSILRDDETTVADLFASAGYRTGVFGKWHLGDNYPYRAQDRGFQESLVHGGGGITQTPDFWGNDYFDDTYWHNGRPEPQTGYCTDVFFNAALDFIEQNRERPFFAYIPTNAAHGPFLVAETYSEPYRRLGVPSPQAEFFGMIANIDENMARLREKLKAWDLERKTILIFMTDNGTAAGYRKQRGKTHGFNAGMRGTKGSEYDGGHRVPFFIHWPGKFEGGRDVDQLAAHLDVLPTLLELCGIEKPSELALDGRSLIPLLNGTADWSPRTLFVQSHRIEHPEPWRKSAVLTDRWRLVNGTELYDMKTDPGQKTDVASRYPDLSARLRQAYKDWYADVSTRFDEYVPIQLGAADANPTTLTCHDWHADLPQIPWNQQQVSRDPEANGFWAVEVLRDGTYEFTLRGRPAGVEHRLPPGTARIQIGNVEARQPIPAEASAVSLVVDLKAGESRLQTWLDGQDGTSRGAFFVEVQRVEK